MLLDTFNKRLLIHFNAPVNMTSINTAGFVLHSGASVAIPLIDSQTSAPSQVEISLSYPSLVESRIENTFANWSALTINIDGSAYAFAANTVQVVYGIFPVVFYCLYLAFIEP